jgi:hypothetical protein
LHLYKKLEYQEERSYTHEGQVVGYHLKKSISKS